jgi:anti-sigma B factor antagonist
MEITERRAADVVILSISGDLTMGPRGRMVLAEMVRHVLQQGPRRIVVELADVRYVDSSGLGELAEANAAAHTRGATLLLSGVGQRLAGLLALTKLEDVFEFYEDHDQEAAHARAAASGGRRR